PFGTAQKPQRRLQTPPRIKNVAVPLPKHSPMFGQCALRQTVCKPSSRINLSTLLKSRPAGMRCTSQDGRLVVFFCTMNSPPDPRMGLCNCSPGQYTVKKTCKFLSNYCGHIIESSLDASVLKAGHTKFPNPARHDGVKQLQIIINIESKSMAGHPLFN